MGFRPFIYRLATRLQLTGFVRNSPAGVTLEAQGTDVKLEEFKAAILEEAPPLAAIGSITDSLLPACPGESGFRILPSGEGVATAEIPPDGDLCGDCLRELFDPKDRRYRYPFITCTNCGPRYSIITGLPYDRPLTTMSHFPMCPACRKEYENPGNRRFHAQPVACPVCGPSIKLVYAGGNPVSGDPLEATVNLLKRGAIVAVKGTGGYHLAVDARSSEAVSRLRLLKRRSSKPFAVMVADDPAVEAIACVDPLEARLLNAPERPIVLLKKTGSVIANEVAPDSNYLGVMLPSTPLQHLLLRDFGGPLVMTSGNRSGEPIAYRDKDALEALAGIADAFLTHNRSIHTCIDDSVIRVFRGNPLFLRRSRGYTPRAIRLPFEIPHLLATGAELKNAICLTRGSLAFMSQHIGDLQNVETLKALDEIASGMGTLLGITPERVAHDKHPDYLSTRYALEKNLPAFGVQHHHAHMASCMAENLLEGDVIGVIFDGTGFGDDGSIWGGEFFAGGYDKVTRMGRFRPIPLPGGDAAVREPFRTAISCCYDSFGPEAFDLPLAGWSGMELQSRELLRTVIEKRINSPLTSSCGRLFDAVSALIGVRGMVSYEGQAAIELEAMADNGEGTRRYRYEIIDSGELMEIDWRPLFAGIRDDLRSGANRADMARSFHGALARASVEICSRIRETSGLQRVVLSGGVFQNRLLTENLIEQLEHAGFQIFTHRLVPPNDGGIALGQAIIAGRR